jgi:hypothetical protein
MTGAPRPVRGPLHFAASLIETEVRIEIAATHRKQRKATNSNRNFFRGPGCAGEPAQKVSTVQLKESYFLRAAYRRARALPEPSSMVRKTPAGRATCVYLRTLLALNST